MEIIIGDKKYWCWDLPQFSKKTKNQTITFKIYDTFEGQLDDVIIINKTYYQWVLTGCKLIKHRDCSDKFMRMDDEKKKTTELTIFFENRSGSHLKEVVKSEVRDYLVSKVFKTD